MTDELSDKRRNYSGRILGDEQRKQGIFARIKAFLPRFKGTESSEAMLAGRIHAKLQQDAHQIHAQLQNLKDAIKKELEGHDDGKLWNSFEAVVNALLKDYETIDKKLHVDPKDIEGCTYALQSYNNWIDKAKLWVAMSSHPHDRATIMRAVVEHTMHVSDLIIDRDLKMLKDYVTHEILHLGLDQSTLHLLMARIDGDLAEHIAALTDLKHNKPTDLQMELLQAWKASVDVARDVHYNDALQAIDHILASVAPVPFKEEEQEHLKEIFHRLAFLEEEIPMLIHQYEQIDPADPEQWRDLEENEVYLEISLHQMNQDLRLTPELANRVNDLILNLNEAKRFYRHTG